MAYKGERQKKNSEKKISRKLDRFFFRIGVLLT